MTFVTLDRVKTQNCETRRGLTGIRELGEKGEVVREDEFLFWRRTKTLALVSKHIIKPPSAFFFLLHHKVFVDILSQHGYV